MTSNQRSFPAPEYCILQHRAFASFDDPLFRRADSDGAPVIVVKLGDTEATIPLRPLQRELAITDESDDGRMLALIALALDFVSALRIGDELPAEVLTGQASWEPDAVHLEIARARLQWQLVAWLNSGTCAETPAPDRKVLLQVAEDPAHQAQVQQAFAKAADAFGLPARQAVVRSVEDLAQELAYIEAMRDRLLNRVKKMADKLNRMARTRHGDGSHLETLTQVRRLTLIALRQISHRFEELNVRTEVISALCNIGSQRVFIRSNRDWLYRTQRAWHALLAEWEVAGIGLDQGILRLLNRSYQFLAPRFMPVTEWQSPTRLGNRKTGPARKMVW